MPLSRIDEMLRVLKMDFAELARKVADAQPLSRQLTVEQEAAVVADRRLLLLAICCLSQWTFEAMTRDYLFTDAECIRYLTKLDRLGIIELRPLNRYRLKVAKGFRWLPHGPVMTYFREHVAADYLSGGFDGEGETIMLVHGEIAPSMAQGPGRAAAARRPGLRAGARRRAAHARRGAHALHAAGRHADVAVRGVPAISSASRRHEGETDAMECHAFDCDVWRRRARRVRCHDRRAAAPSDRSTRKSSSRRRSRRSGRAWTSRDGIRTFFAPDAEIDPRVGGAFHIHMDPLAGPGMKGADDMRFMALQRPTMLSFDWNAPPSLPEVRAAAHLRRRAPRRCRRPLDARDAASHRLGRRRRMGQDLRLLRSRLGRRARQAAGELHDGAGRLERVDGAAAREPRCAGCARAGSVDAALVDRPQLGVDAVDRRSSRRRTGRARRRDRAASLPAVRPGCAAG